MSDRDFDNALNDFNNAIAGVDQFEVMYLGDGNGNTVVPGDPARVFMRDRAGNLTRVNRGDISTALPAGTPFFVGNTNGFDNGYQTVQSIAYPAIANYDGRSGLTAYLPATAVGFGDASNNLTGDAAHLKYSGDVLQIDYEGDSGGVAAKASVFLTVRSPNDIPVFSARLADWDGVDSLPVASGRRALSMQAFAYGDTGFSGSSNGRFEFVTSELQADGSHGMAWWLWVTPNGTDVKVNALKALNGGQVAPQLGFALQGAITPATITADEDDYAPIDAVSSLPFTFATRINIDGDADHSITGLDSTNVVDGQEFTFVNTFIFNFRFINFSSSSLAANRFLFPSDIILPPDSTLTIYYDASISLYRWKGATGTASTISGIVPPTLIADTDYTATINDRTIGYTSLSAARTVSLPPTGNVPEGFTLTVKDQTGTASTWNIIIDGDGTETIDGATTQTINNNYGSFTLYKSGSAWYIV